MRVENAVASDIKQGYQQLGAGSSAQRFPAVSTRTGPYSPDETEVQEIATDLVARAKAMADSNGKTVQGYVAFVVDSSEAADCVDGRGQQVSVFQQNQLCYRLRITWSV